MQLRTGHAPLNKHLHTIGKADTPICPACNEHRETVMHYLVDCPAYENLRIALTDALGRAARSVAVLLGRAYAIEPLFKFIAGTRRFEESYGDLEWARE